MGCGCGKKASIKKSKTKTFSDPKWQKCPNCGSKMVNIHRYDKATKKMVAIIKCTNQSCAYVK